jgi:hypothetical protein
MGSRDLDAKAREGEGFAERVSRIALCVLVFGRSQRRLFVYL